MKIWVLLPAYNEEKSLECLLPKIEGVFKQNGLNYTIVVVNDGSSDNTATIINACSELYPVHVITHKINRGLGETERDGFEYIAEYSDSDDIVIRIDCDDTHEPEYFFRLIDKIKEGYDVVSASRFQKGGGQVGVSGYRAFISYCANLFMKLFFHIPGIKDYSCGYRAYRAKILKSAIKIFGNGFIQLKGLGFTSTLETIVKLKLMGCRFAEVPFVLRYDQKVSASKMIGSITSLGYLTMVLLYHWPWLGWKSNYKGLSKIFRVSPEQAESQFAYGVRKKNLISRIGGG
jgi:dolichol-phosphate mannosyltransferase